MEAKRTKQGLPPQKITNQAHQNAKNLDARNVDGKSKGSIAAIDSKDRSGDERSKKVEQAYEKAKSAKSGSITAKANMVRDFDERNKKK